MSILAHAEQLWSHDDRPEAYGMRIEREDSSKVMKMYEMQTKKKYNILLNYGKQLWAEVR